MRQIAVLGAGFAGLRATHTLEKRLESRRHTSLTLVAPSTHFLYRPLLAPVVSGQLEPSSISIPLADLVDESTDLVVDRIDRIDLDERRIVGEDGEVPFDYLLVAPAPVVDWRGRPEWSEHAQPFETPGDAADIRRMVHPPDSNSAPDRLIVVGAGPNGVELAGQLHTALRTDGTAESIPPEILLADRAEIPLPDHPVELRRACWEYLRLRGVEFAGEATVSDIRDRQLHLEDVRSLPTDPGSGTAIFWCGGNRAPDFVDSSSLPTDERGRLRVDETLAATSSRGIYAAGAAASEPRQHSSTPGVVGRLGRFAAENLLADLSGRTPVAPQLDEPTWTIALGTDEAAVYRNGAVVTGQAGAALHRLVHTSLIPGAAKKVSLLGEWLKSTARL